jgi:hypothetical protein
MRGPRKRETDMYARVCVRESAVVSGCGEGEKDEGEGERKKSKIKRAKRDEALWEICRRRTLHAATARPTQPFATSLLRTW